MPIPRKELFTFRPQAFGIAIALFVTEVLIALYVHDEIIRPFVGDVLVVIFIYYFLKAFLKIPLPSLAIFTLVFSFSIEILQYFKLVDLLGLGHYKLARIVIGTSFSWLDLACYAIGMGLVFIFDKELRASIKKTH